MTTPANLPSRFLPRHSFRDLLARTLMIENRKIYGHKLTDEEVAKISFDTADAFCLEMAKRKIQ